MSQNGNILKNNEIKNEQLETENSEDRYSDKLAMPEPILRMQY